MITEDPVNHLSQIRSPIVPEKSKLLVKESVDASVLRPSLIHMGVGHDKLVEDFLTGEMSNIALKILRSTPIYWFNQNREFVEMCHLSLLTLAAQKYLFLVSREMLMPRVAIPRSRPSTPGSESSWKPRLALLVTSHDGRLLCR